MSEGKAPVAPKDRPASRATVILYPQERPTQSAATATEPTPALVEEKLVFEFNHIATFSQGEAFTVLGNQDGAFVGAFPTGAIKAILLPDNDKLSSIVVIPDRVSAGGITLQ